MKSIPDDKRNELAEQYGLRKNKYSWFGNWLDAGLHFDLDKIVISSKQALAGSSAEGVDASVLYGSDCHHDMCHISDNYGGKILGAKLIELLK